VQYQRELDIARTAVLRAGQEALRLQRGALDIQRKPDHSPVTVADRLVEQILVEALLEGFPDDGLLSEEGAQGSSRSGRRWILDPIDGTRDFARGSRMWAIFVALEEAQQIQLGICHFPAWGETYWAVSGAGAWCNDRRVHVSRVSDPAQAVLCLNELQRAHAYPFGGRLIEWMSRFWAVRCAGGCVDAMNVAAGRADIWIDPHAEPWDLAPIKVIVEEAGGRFLNFDGGSSIYGGNCVLCTPALEAEVMTFLAGSR